MCVGRVTLKIENVECCYGSTRILKDISFEARSGGFIGLIGPNGSGKTTLLRSISRILKPRVGAVLLDGRDVYSLEAKEVAKKMGVVPQEPMAPFQFTASEIVLMGRTPHLKWLEHEGEKDYSIAKKAMEITNTRYLSDRVFTELSSGEKQRVIIARALTQEPKVLLLDEPTSHLDINHQVEILNLIKKLSEKGGLTIVAVFHDLNLAAQYCDHLILLNQGEIESIGSPEAVLTPENIKRVYHTEVLVKRHPITNSLYLIPFSGPRPLTIDHGFTIHLICGAGTGAPLMNNLLNRGYRVTAGVLGALDTDYEVATYLNIPVVTDPPFSPASEEAHKTNLKFVERANVVVLTDMPIGWGNIKNLKAAGMALKKGISLIIVEGTPFEERDFTVGEAQKLLNNLKLKGATCIKSLNEVLPTINKLRGVKPIAKIKK